ncbi:MAG TPA: Calx-beta domain-containing protein, partial [Vicinamibacterales bacterium]|nr:Calx-beta domain-containing protein [Vicinamibacterales bacterium]
MRRVSTVATVLLLVSFVSGAARGAELRAHGANTGLEGNDGNTVLSFTYDIPFPINSTITGNYTTVDGTATAADNDYVPTSGTFTIPAGSTRSNTIQVVIVGDRRVEADETFSIVASNVVNGAPPPPRVITIL